MARRVVYSWMKRLHTYAGLLSFTSFVVWGLIGVAGAFAPAPGAYEPPAISATREFPMTPPANLDDHALARYIYDRLHIPLRGGHYDIRRNHDGELAFRVFTASGPRDVTWLEDRSVVRMDVRQNGMLEFLSTMHTAYSNRGPQTRAARLWGYYNECSAWAFLFMIISGLYLWLDTRPGLRWAQLLAATSVGGSIVLWMVTR